MFWRQMETQRDSKKEVHGYDEGKHEGGILNINEAKKGHPEVVV